MNRIFASRPSRAAIAATAAWLLLSVMALRLGAAEDDEGVVLAVNARVVDATGWPVEHVRVSISGSKSESEVTGSNGRALLRVGLGTPEEIARHPVELSIRAGDRNPAYALTDGSEELKLELWTTATGLSVRSSGASLTLAVARMLRVSEGRSIAIELLFLATPSRSVKKAVLGAAEEIALAGMQPANPAKPVSPQPSPMAPQRTTAATDSARASAAAASRGKSAPPAATKPLPKQAAVMTPPVVKQTPGSSATVTPPAVRQTPGSSAVVSPPAVKQTAGPSAAARPEPSPPPIAGAMSQTTRTQPRAISTPSDEVPVITAAKPARENEKECRCRLTGTVEVNWDHPLPRPLEVRVSLLDQPAIHDSMTLFMGSPRGFVLEGVPCGAHRVLVALPDRRPFAVATPESGLLFNCERAWIRPMRVVLVRR